MKIRAFYSLLFFFLIPCALIAKRGDVISYKEIGKLSSKQMDALKREFSMNELPKTMHAVKLYRLMYKTLDLNNEEIFASGLIVMPEPEKPYPLVCFGHGTMPNRLDVPSKLSYQAKAAIAAFASGEYILVAPDYLGLGESSLPFHPYCHIESMSTAAVDMLRAASSLLFQIDRPLSKDVYISGYSQGGLGAMALHQTIQRDYDEEFEVKASAPMAGPYDLTLTIQSIIKNPHPVSSMYLSYLLLAYNNIYEDIFENLTTAVLYPYSSLVPNLFDYHQPTDLIISLMPSSPDKLLTASFINEINNPKSAFTLSLKENSLYKWLPKAPVLIIGAEGDTEVPFANAKLAYEKMKELGADVQIKNVGDHLDHTTGRSPCHVEARKFFDQIAYP